MGKRAGIRNIKLPLSAVQLGRMERQGGVP